MLVRVFREDGPPRLADQLLELFLLQVPGWTYGGISIVEACLGGVVLPGEHSLAESLLDDR